MNHLILYDTSNFKDFPIGGQLTSIRNFLRFISERHSEIIDKLFLVGVTTNPKNVGVIQTIEVLGRQISFLPVVFRSQNLNQVRSSLRIEFLKGLFRYMKVLPTGEDTIHFIHTPEAFIAIDLLRKKEKIAIFSHGSFFNMVQGFRFYKGNRVIEFAFNRFIKVLLKRSDLIFALDQDSFNQYIKYNNRVFIVDNSIDLPQHVPVKHRHTPLRLLFVGRLSAVKQIDKIINSISIIPFETSLTIVGDGEMKEQLEACVKQQELEEKIRFIGAISPEKVKDYLECSDVLVMNSAVEGKPMTIIEAMSYGLPIVSTNVGGIWELTNGYHCSELTDGTEVGICNALCKIIDDYETYSACSIKQSKQYDYRIVNEAILDKLKDL